jgi:dienelactone hydrolase
LYSQSMIYAFMLCLWVRPVRCSLVVASFAAASAFAQSVPEGARATIALQGAGAFGSALRMDAEVFRPAGDGPFPVMVYAHGRAGTQQERSALRDVVPRQYLQFWLARGFAVVGVARPGYGRTGGADREMPGHTWEGPGKCGGALNPERVAETAGAAMSATIEWVRQQAWAKPNAIVLTGNSVGGMTTAFLGSRSPEGVTAFINFAGGVGGNPSLSPNKSCAPERLSDFFARLGASSRMPNLWLYAENDLFWGADAPKAWHAAYVSAGAAQSTFVATGPVAAPDGHSLIFVGRALWEPYVDAFLKKLGL